MSSVPHPTTYPPEHTASIQFPPFGVACPQPPYGYPYVLPAPQPITQIPNAVPPSYIPTFSDPSKPEDFYRIPQPQYDANKSSSIFMHGYPDRNLALPPELAQSLTMEHQARSTLEALAKEYQVMLIIMLPLAFTEFRTV